MGNRGVQKGEGAGKKNLKKKRNVWEFMVSGRKRQLPYI